MNDILSEALDELDRELTSRSLELEVVICGAYALRLIGYDRVEHTLDIDSMSPLSTQEILDAIEDVGTKLKLGPKWLNDQAASVAFPEGAIGRARPIQRWRSIKASVVTREDLIKMKASAFSIRRDHTNKDWEDLILLGPSRQEIRDAIEFVTKVNSPPKGAPRHIVQEFQETLNDLKKLAK